MVSWYQRWLRIGENIFMSYCYIDNHEWGRRSRQRQQHTDQTRSARSRLNGLSRKSRHVRVPSHRPWPDTGNIVYEPNAGILWALPLWGAAESDRDACPRRAGDVAICRGENSAIWHGLSSSQRYFAAEALASATPVSLAALLAGFLLFLHQRASLAVTRNNARPLDMPA